MQKSLFSVNDFSKIKTDLNVSYRAVYGIAAALRTATKNINIVETGLKLKLPQKTHIVDDFFTFKEFPFMNKKGNISSEATESAVYCKDVSSFISFVNNQRQIDFSSCGSSEKPIHLKLGIDGGGGFLKICLSIQTKNDSEDHSESKRRKYKDGISAKKL